MATPDRPPSPPLNIESQRPGETATEYANRLLAHLKEAQRQKEEAQRQKEEAQHREEEAQHREEEAQRREADERRRRLQADLEAQRAIESQRHLARSNELLQEELRQQRNQTSPQALPAYLVQVSRLQTHAVRLLPYRPLGSIPLHIQRSSASGAASRSSSPQPTTSGRTDIANKYYPLHLCPWVGFREEVQRKGFARIYGALQQSTHHGLPSRDWVQKDETTLLEDLPLLALNQEGGLNAARTHDFLKTVLLTPASRILNEYLNHSLGAADKKIFFDTAAQSIATRLGSGTEHSSNSRNADNADNANNAENDENADNLPNTQSTDTKKLPQKVFPDCLVYCIDLSTTAANPVQLVASAENKPLHAIRAAFVSRITEGPLLEDLVIRLARQALARREKKQRQSAERGQAPASALASAPQAEPGQRLPSDATSKTQKLNKLTYFAYALTQAYHYMFTAGLEFGFLATGEVLVFLRIPEEDATTLYYHVSLFPIPSLTVDSAENSSNDVQHFQAVAQAPYPAPGDPVGEEALAELPIAQIASFCEYAMHAERRAPAWIMEQSTKLARFPELPADVAARYNQGLSSQLGRRRYDDDDGGGNDDDSNDGGNGGNGPSRQLQIPHQGSRVQGASPLQQHMASRSSPEPAESDIDISATFLSTPCDLQARPRPSYKVKRPVLPYCTHACLLGLVKNGPLDAQCPNYTLHQAAGRQDGEKSSQHPLTSLQLAQRIRDQLFDTPEVDCECSLSHCGAIGFPFKLTLTGFGYTFVGKAVRKEHRRRLVRESAIYKALLPLQGSVLPVHLGLIRLHVGYPIPSRFLQLPYMMLLSYAGASMVASLRNKAGEKKDMSPKVARDRAEAARTERELKSWGLDDEDNNASNVRWCAETGRAMRIDFERAQLVPTQNRKHVLLISTNSHAFNASQTHSSQTASSRNTPTTPRWEEEADFLDVTGKTQGEPLAKRRKVDDNDAVWQPVR